MTFQKIVLTTAIISLLIILIIIGMSLSKTKDEQWPPMVGQCPDYWVDVSGNCVNTHHLGRCNIPTAKDKNAMNFNESPFVGSNELCAKYTWATSCGVTWDGITSGIPNPCSTSTT